MGLLDNLYLGHGANFGGQGGGLLDFLRTTQMQQGQYQPSQGFGNPMDANAQMQAAPMDIGGYQMPRIGGADQFTPDQAAIPQNAQPTQGQMQAPQQPMESPGGFGAGLQGFLRNLHTGPIGAIAGGVGSAMGMQDPAKQQQNQTAQFLVSKGMDRAMAKTVVSDPALLRSVLPQIMGMGGQTDDIKEYQFAKKENPSLTFDQFMQQKRAVSGKYGMQGYWGSKNGKPSLIQLGKDGVPVEVPMPEGFELAKEPYKVDTGTHINEYDPQTRSLIRSTPKDLTGKERAEAVGKGLGAADVDLASIRSKMPGLETVVKKLDGLSERATYTIAGQAVDYANRQAGLEPRDAAVARTEYISMVDNQVLPLLRDTFGAAFTQKEGEALRATLGDPNKSPKEKQAVLRSFIEQKRRDVEALETRTGSAPASTTAPKRIRLNADGTIAQ